MSNSLIPEPTADGSFTFFSQEFQEAFHSHYGARQEAEFKFVVPTRVRERAATGAIALLDICYGLGYNTAAALDAIWQVNPDCRVRWYGLETDPEVCRASLARGWLDAVAPPVLAVLQQLAATHTARTPLFQGTLLVGDARATIRSLAGMAADAIFLDPFSPPKCPQLWTVAFFQAIARCLNPTGYLATYSCAAAVRRGLVEAGWHIGSTPPMGRKTPGTLARSLAAGLPPLSAMEREHLHTRAAVPYRDLSGSDRPSEILQRRDREQATSPLEPTSHWRKRWARFPNCGKCMVEQ